MVCPLVQLPEEESVHCVRVLRLAAGSEILVVDGAGHCFRALIIDPHPKRCMVKTIEPYAFGTELAYSLRVAIAPTKNLDRFEWFMEKATEIGVSRITPLLCDRSERKNVPMERLARLLVSAMKQSHKSFLPELDAMMPFGEFVKHDSAAVRAIAHCATGPKEPLWNCYRSGDPLTVMIGPEGDFSEREVALAESAGFVPITLGASRLRTETAGVVVCQSVSLLADLPRY